MAQKFLISGGTGLVGQFLTNLLISEGKEVVHLTRNPREGSVKQFYWHPDKQEGDKNALNGVDTIIHLAGEGVADKRWSESQKKRILDSRVKSTQLLVSWLKAGNHQVKSFVSASAVGIYGPYPSGRVTENHPAGEGFLANVCVEWENEANKAKAYVDHLAILRIGLVLSTKGGFLKAIQTPAKFGFAAAFGSNKAIQPWIHIQDLARMFYFVSEQRLNGVFNATAPNPVSSQVMMKSVCSAMGSPYFLPAVPVPVLKVLFGEMGGMLAASQQVVPEKLLNSGFSFEFPELNWALADLLRSS